MNYNLSLNVGELKIVLNAVTEHLNRTKDSKQKTAVKRTVDKVNLLFKYAKLNQQAQRLTRQAEAKKQKYEELLTGSPVMQKKPEPIIDFEDMNLDID